MYVLITLTALMALDVQNHYNGRSSMLISWDFVTPSLHSFFEIGYSYEVPEVGCSSKDVG